VERQVVPVVYVAELVELMGEEGIDPREVLRGTGLSRASLGDRDAFITAEQQLRVYENARGLSRKPGLGLRLGARLRVGHHGVLGHALLCSESVRQALKILVRYTPVRGAFLGFRLRVQGRVATLSAFEAIPLGRVHETAVEEMLGMWAQKGTWRANPIPKPIEIRIDYPAPAHRAMYERLYECPLRFGADAVEWRFPAKLLDAPLELSNAEMVRICEERCEVILNRLGAAGGFVDRVRTELLAEPHRLLDLEAVARAIHVSPRTLRRKLKEEGSSFREILTQVRKNLALDYLERSNLSLEEIATLLGYGDAANFNRAFGSWIGDTPGRYRTRRVSRARSSRRPRRRRSAE
jgi:AraC-like DNA-binding protein